MSTTADWRRLPAGAFKVTADQPGADAMWVWAEATGYRDHGDGGPPKSVWLAVEHAAGGFTALQLTPKEWAVARKQFTRAELALPVVPERPPRHAPRQPPDQAVREPPQSEAKVLIGVIDSGCPFAAPMLRRGRETRVLSIWDQDDEPAFGGCGAYPPKGFGYGAAINRHQLNELIRGTANSDGGVEEERAYARAGCDSLRGRFSHGAAVLSQLFSGEIDPEHLAARPGPEPIDSADLVFVELPRAAVQDSTSAALVRYVIDALRFIAASAKPDTERIVVNLSSGTSRTSHDGKSLLERALVDWTDRMHKGWIVVPVGNTNQEQRHAVLRDTGGCLELFVPPDCETPQYVTVRWPIDAKQVGLRIEPPGSDLVTVERGHAMGWFDERGARCGVVSPQPTPNSAARSLLVIAPTASPDRQRAVAPSGRWKISLHFGDKGETLGDDVHFWVSRNQRNPGGAARHGQASFVDRDEMHNPQRYVDRHVDDPPGVADKNGIRRAGALSGLATVGRKDGRIVVVGGHVDADPTHSPSRYSASGPAAGTDPSRRPRPDVMARADTSTALQGVTVRGNRAGETARVAGTSFAAPLVARDIANRGELLREKTKKAGPPRPSPRPGVPNANGPRRAPLLLGSR